MPQDPLHDSLLAWFRAPKRPLLIIAGPCVIEQSATNDLIASTLHEACTALKLPLVFKASFDKANRSSIKSKRGLGIDRGLAELARIRDAFRVPVTTDIHDPAQASLAARSVDMLQIPAFLCRQTDLLVAAAETKIPVNVKKGQFMSPAEMKNVLDKLKESGCDFPMLTERGTFFGYNRLVNDFIGVGDMMELGAPVCFDATHSTQLPGGGGTATAGRPERVPLLAKSAVAAGVDAIFLECHPKPSESASDAATIQPLSEIPALLRTLVAIRQAISSHS